MSAAKLPLKPTDKDCQQRGERDSFWQTLMPGLITGNYREEAQSKGPDGAALECVGCGNRVSQATATQTKYFSNAEKVHD